MPINFSPDRWQNVRNNARLWWAGELKRPLIHLAVKGNNPGRPEPSLPHHPFTAFYDLSVSAEQIVDRWDYELSQFHYLGDAFPAIWPNFGPGVMAAFMGARLETGASTVWFHPTKDEEIADIQWHYQPDNVWLKRVKEVCRAAMDRWQGLVQVGMTDLGGNLDVLSSFRPSEKLLFDLCDHPDEVKKLTWREHEMWWRYFDEIQSVLRPVNPGYTAWTPIFSEAPYYILQCDFCYMIGPEMFDEFVKPELAASCKRLVNPFYHLDGVGELPHLDSLLSIKELKGIQWVPGEGKPGAPHWIDVYRKIRKAGKLIHVLGTMDEMDALAKQLGSAEGLVYIASIDAADEKRAREFLRRHGAE
ncbi:MAG: hypothetical protein PHV34_04315 [Verrucomicrobiae bacterium]|nr:hypothetical protein [Verrucomicrobiae bacterium]